MSKSKKELTNIMIKYGFNNVKEIHINEVGLDFQVVFYNNNESGDWILRFPRRMDVYDKALVEKNFLDLLNQKGLFFGVPKFLICEKELIAYKKVQGTPVVSTNEDSSLNWKFEITSVPVEYTDSLGRALFSLHSLASEKRNDFNIKSDKASGLRNQMRKKIEVVQSKIKISSKLLRRWEEWLNNEEYWPSEVGLIHGDLYPGHILADKDNNVIGIIDWTEAKISDMAYDFLAHYKLFGEEELVNLLDAYKRYGGYHYNKMKEHIIELSSTEGLIIAEFAILTNNDEYISIAKELLSQ